MRNPFKREKNPTIAELENYYAGQRRTKRGPGAAWLMAILSLLVTLIIIAALYFGVRWIYRTFSDDTGNDVSISDIASDPEFGEVRVGGTDEPSTDDGEQSNEDRVADVLGGNSDSNDSSEGVVSDEAASTTRSNDSDVAGDTTTIVGAGATVELPNTGAGEQMIVLTIALVATGYIAARKFQLR